MKLLICSLRKNLPRAIVGGIILVMCLYVMVNFAFISVLSNEEIKTTTLVAETFASKIAGRSRIYLALSMLKTFYQGPIFPHPLFCLSVFLFLAHLLVQASLQGGGAFQHQEKIMYQGWNN